MCTCQAAGRMVPCVSVMSEKVVTLRNFRHRFAESISCIVSVVVPLDGNMMSMIRLSLSAQVLSWGRSLSMVILVRCKNCNVCLIHDDSR